MAEGSLYDRELAALAVQQAQGDLVEAVFLLRAYRTTLPRFGVSEPVDTGRLRVERRISAAFKDLPGGQVLGPTYDYTHRLLDFELADPAALDPPRADTAPPLDPVMPRIADILSTEDLIEGNEEDGDGTDDAGDLTREPLTVPAGRPVRLQNLARGDEGFLLAMGYSVQRGFGASVHPFVGEIRSGTVAVEMVPEELGFAVEIGDVELTECVMLSRFTGSGDAPPRFLKGYGLAFGGNERKAMAMSLVDRALRARELGEDIDHPAQDEEFVLYHSDNVEASGFVQHLKLPHYVDFQADLVLMRGLRDGYETERKKRESAREDGAASDAA
jgi:alpha-D-ribose 1-methylphosphonate 5-triphosphate synthase subunit PhnI